MGRRVLAILVAAVVALVGVAAVLVYARGADERAIAAQQPATFTSQPKQFVRNHVKRRHPRRCHHKDLCRVGRPSCRSAHPGNGQQQFFAGSDRHPPRGVRAVWAIWHNARR